eukprot:c14733_g1_i1 orf=277-1638(-)
MASSDGGGQLYHCHQCDITVRPASLSPLTCPQCHDGFLEECPDSPPSSPELHSPWDYMGGFGQLLDDISTFLARTDVSTVNPFLLFQSQVQNLLSGEDDDFANGADFVHTHMPGDHIGPGLQQLIQHLAENDPNRYGTPPASMSAIEALPTVSISQEHLRTDAAQCAVCKDEFELCLQVRQMPCRHLYHPDCILPWLAQHNSCPVCRFELPTDDQEYEHLRIRRQGLAEPAGIVGTGSAVQEIRGDLGASSSGGISREHSVEVIVEEGRVSSEHQSASSSGTSGLPQVTHIYGSEESGGVLIRRMLPATPSILDALDSSATVHAESLNQARLKDLSLSEDDVDSSANVHAESSSQARLKDLNSSEDIVESFANPHAESLCQARLTGLSLREDVVESSAANVLAESSSQVGLKDLRLSEVNEASNAIPGQIVMDIDHKSGDDTSRCEIRQEDPD